jgi:hypothetical protein
MRRLGSDAHSRSRTLSGAADRVMQAATEYSRLRVGAGGGAMQAAKEYSSYFEPPKRARLNLR